MYTFKHLRSEGANDTGLQITDDAFDVPEHRVQFLSSLVFVEHMLIRLKLQHTTKRLVPHKFVLGEAAYLKCEARDLQARGRCGLIRHLDMIPQLWSVHVRHRRDLWRDHSVLREKNQFGLKASCSILEHTFMSLSATIVRKSSRPNQMI